MSETTITQLPDPKDFTFDPFTNVLRDGARKLIEQVIHAELDALMSTFSGERFEDGRARLVRHGHWPEGVSKNCTSISRISARFCFVSPCGV